MKTWLSLFFGAWVLVVSSAAHAQVELRNDTFMDGGNAGFQSGFTAGEIGASRFDAPAATQKLLKVTMLFGGTEGVTRDVVLHVYDDTGGTVQPGASLFSGEFQVVSSNSAIQELDVSVENIMVPETFRIGIEMVANGLPSIARDEGPVDAAHNFIRLTDGQWVDANVAFGLEGDWIIRATVEGQGGTTASTSAATTGATSSDAVTASSGAGPGSGASSAAGGSSANGAGGGSGDACSGNGDCPPYQYCSDRGACTFDCRADADCAEGQACNSLGQCIGGESGCDCRADRGEDEGAWTSFLAIAAVITGGGALRLRRRAARSARD